MSHLLQPGNGKMHETQQDLMWLMIMIYSIGLDD